MGVDRVADRPERDARLAPPLAHSPLDLIGKWQSVPFAHG